MTYAEALSRLGSRDSKKVGNNTTLERRSDGIAVRLHYTDVVLIHPDGTCTLNSGGWRTLTTKERINAYSPARLYQHKGEWFLASQVFGDTEFHDGIRIDAGGNPTPSPVTA